MAPASVTTLVAPVSREEAIALLYAVDRAATLWPSRDGAMRRLALGLDLLVVALGGRALGGRSSCLPNIELPASPSEAAEYVGRAEAAADALARGAASKTERAERNAIRAAAVIAQGALQDFGHPPPAAAAGGA